MRVIPKTLLIAVAAVALMGAGGDGGPDEDENSIVYQADIQDRNNQYASVTKILVSGPDGALSASGWRGFDRRNQNRIDYSATPIFGQLSEPRYDKQDFTEYNRIGEVRVDGSTLAIVLDEAASEKLADIRMIAVLNQNHAFETRGSLKASGSAAGWQSRGRVVGDAYLIGDGVALALVRPFVVTDSGLW
jgi:hypothetical protein